MTYLALICDLIDSRSIPDRHSTQIALQSLLDRANKRFKDRFVSRLTITLGDEFQALLHPDANPFEIVDWLQMHLPEHPFRCGLGLGEITTPIDPKRSIGADGPAYWRAREAIDELHQHDDYGAVQIRCHGLDPLDSIWMNDLLATTEILKDAWTDLQRATFLAILDQGIYSEDFSQKALAAQLKISENALYKRLRSTQIKVYLRARHHLYHYLLKGAPTDATDS